VKGEASLSKLRTASAAPAPPRSVAYGGLAVGLALFTALVAYQGVREVARALATGGAGLLGVALFHLVPMFADAMGWRRVLGTRGQPRISTMWFARWVGESVNALLPVMQIGGNVAKARVIARRGVPGPVAGASVVVDVTLVMLSQLVFTVAGIVLLIGHLGGRTLLPAAATGLGLGGLALAGFVVAQRLGLFASAARVLSSLRRRGARGALVGDAEALDAVVARLYRDRRALIASAAWHLASWVAGTGEVWLALRVLGHPADLWTATLLESLGQAVRAAAFAVPGALGVQEGGFLLLGAALGIAPETALALSLAKRVREIVLGLPGLVAWQVDGTRGLVRRGPAREEGTEA
jgi:putative membrane protein